MMPCRDPQPPTGALMPMVGGRGSVAGAGVGVAADAGEAGGSTMSCACGEAAPDAGADACEALSAADAASEGAEAGRGARRF